MNQLEFSNKKRGDTLDASEWNQLVSATNTLIDTYNDIPDRVSESVDEALQEVIESGAITGPKGDKGDTGEVDVTNFYTKSQADDLFQPKGDYLTEHQDISEKVDKITGKGLSTNDYTDTEKEKLAGLENYDDTQVKQLINEEKTARQQSDNALSESITQEETRAKNVEQTFQLAIDTINGKIPAQATSQNQLADKEFVNSSVSTATAGFNSTLESKQDVIQDLATIRSGASAGATALQPEYLNAYYTKSETDNLLTQKPITITDGAQIGLGFGVSSEAATVQARTADITNFILLKNMPVSIRFTNSINVNRPTLNISSTGAKPLFINGTALQSGLINGECTVTVIYDGTAWNIVGMFDMEQTQTDESLFVDMGLPSGVKWAKASIDLTTQSGFQEVNGEISPFKYECSFFSWGNIDGHNPSSTSTFDYDWGGMNEQKPYYDGQPYGTTPGYTLTGNIPLSMDAARVNLGAPWRMPSTEEVDELFANIDYIDADGNVVPAAYKWQTVNGINGIYLQSKINGNRLFFPASGLGDGRSWDYRTEIGFFWQSTPYTEVLDRYARNLYFYDGGVLTRDTTQRYCGVAIRPVQ